MIGYGQGFATKKIKPPTTFVIDGPISLMQGYAPVYPYIRTFVLSVASLSVALQL